MGMRTPRPTTDSDITCARCGQRVGQNPPLGLCPRCLMETALTPTADPAPVPLDFASRQVGDYDAFVYFSVFLSWQNYRITPIIL